MADTADIQAVLANEQIMDLLALWCAAFNAGDAALMTSLFAVGGEMAIAGVTGKAGVMSGRLVALSPTWKASSANECIDMGEEEAAVESYIFLTSGAGGGFGRHHAGRALDRFIAGPDGWRFASRRLVIDWALDGLEQAA